VLAGLNDAFAMEKHNNMYFTIWYGVLHRPTRALRYCSAGHPPAVVVADGGPPACLRSDAMPIGTWPDAVFPEGVTTLPPAARLYLFSDGAYELTRTDGSLMRYDDFVAVLAARGESSGPARLAAVIDAARATQGAPGFEDDVSLLELTFA